MAVVVSIPDELVEKAIKLTNKTNPKEAIIEVIKMAIEKSTECDND